MIASQIPPRHGEGDQAQLGGGGPGTGAATGPPPPSAAPTVPLPVPGRNSWLTVHQGDAPLIVAFPHTGTDLADRESTFVSPWIARCDTDWWIDRLYAFAADLGATTIRTAISRSIIDVNRDPTGASLYPGQATTELCPTTTFDGDPLYPGTPPDAAEIVYRRVTWFDPYHAAIAAEIARLRRDHSSVVLYDAHSIRSRVPRLFDGELPQFNVGTNGGATCDAALTRGVSAACGDDQVIDGRFRGGWTTRHYGRPETGVHAIQMELAMRGYMAEPDHIDETNWPSPIDPAPRIATTLRAILTACLDFAR